MAGKRASSTATKTITSGLQLRLGPRRTGPGVFRRRIAEHRCREAGGDADSHVDRRFHRSLPDPEVGARLGRVFERFVEIVGTAHLRRLNLNSQPPCWKLDFFPIERLSAPLASESSADWAAQIFETRWAAGSKKSSCLDQAGELIGALNIAVVDCLCRDGIRRQKMTKRRDNLFEVRNDLRHDRLHSTKCLMQHHVSPRAVVRK